MILLFCYNSASCTFSQIRIDFIFSCFWNKNVSSTNHPFLLIFNNWQRCRKIILKNMEICLLIHIYLYRMHCMDYMQCMDYKQIVYLKRRGYNRCLFHPFKPIQVVEAHPYLYIHILCLFVQV